jgi:hypothetical protein
MEGGSLEMPQLAPNLTLSKHVLIQNMANTKLCIELISLPVE